MTTSTLCKLAGAAAAALLVTLPLHAQQDPTDQRLAPRSNQIGETEGQREAIGGLQANRPLSAAPAESQQDRDAASASAVRSGQGTPGQGAAGARQPLGTLGNAAGDAAAALPGGAAMAGAMSDAAVAQWLTIDNMGEIQFSQFGQMESQNEEVKSFSQMMVRDHQQYIERLQPFTQGMAPMGAGGGDTLRRAPGAATPATDPIGGPNRLEGSPGRGGGGAGGGGAGGGTGSGSGGGGGDSGGSAAAGTAAGDVADRVAANADADEAMTVLRRDLLANNEATLPDPAAGQPSIGQATVAAGQSEPREAIQRLREERAEAVADARDLDAGVDGRLTANEDLEDAREDVRDELREAGAQGRRVAADVTDGDMTDAPAIARTLPQESGVDRAFTGTDLDTRPEFDQDPVPVDTGVGLESGHEVAVANYPQDDDAGGAGSTGGAGAGGVLGGTTGGAGGGRGQADRAAARAGAAVGDAAAGGAGMVPETAVLSIHQRISQQTLAAKREMLQNLQGEQFDLAFMKEQVGLHQKMLATLQTFQQEASPRLQPLIQEGLQATNMHLEQAQRIVSTLSPQAAGGDQGGDR